MQGARPVDTTGSGGSRAATTGAAGTSGAGGGAGSASDAGGSGGSSDGAVEGGHILHDDASTNAVPCTGNRASFGSRLQAGGATPAAFAQAYNAELDALRGPGPFLLVLLGVNDPMPGAWVGALGALDPGDAGAGARFADDHAVVRFTLGAARSIQIPATDASFRLKFAPPASDALVPVVSVALSGTLTPGCGSLAMTKAKFLVPQAAGSVSFHGSTIAALMGAPTETWQGQAASAWLFELEGTAKQVYAPGVLDDGGAE
jgi:hypothetical protein